MSDDAQIARGRELLEETARHFAGEHGLRPELVEWEDQGYQWLLKVIDPVHTVRVIFSPDEIEMFAEELPENRGTKMKIRNAFASLSM